MKKFALGISSILNFLAFIMLRRLFFTGLFLGQILSVCSQDTTKILNEVTVQSYLYNRPLELVPAAIGLVNMSDLSRFNDASILPGVNTISGVRMEERSPGSYRLSIRGSLIRSPFGIRNVKMYWNGLPFTDGGGNTYFNLLDVSSLGGVEIIKGPAGSIYGAGTGGVILLRSPDVSKSSVSLSTGAGSFGLRRVQLGAAVRSKDIVGSLSVAHQESDGFRKHTTMKRDVVNADVKWQANTKNILSATILYSDIWYQTPGGLTLAQYQDDPAQARPTVGLSRGAVDQNAFVENKTIYSGISHDAFWNEKVSTRTGVFYSSSDFVNYAIRAAEGLEERDEKNIGARTETKIDLSVARWKAQISVGGEYHKFDSPIGTWNNESGEKGALAFKDEISSKIGLLFLQSEISLNNFYVTLGGSVNFLEYDFKRNEPTTEKHTRQFSPVFSPRIAILQKLNKNVSIFGSVSSGFSPPSLAEVRPSTNTYNNSLAPERGLNTELGLRGRVSGAFKFDLTAYSFRLKETIVIQRTDDDADYFINAGETRQRGFEGTLSWEPTFGKDATITGLKFWLTETWNHFRFKDYVNDNTDYSGNKLTGVPPTVLVFGADVEMSAGVYSNITASFTDHVPLDDANSEYAKSYILCNARVGYRGKLGSNIPFEIFGGVDNALNETYSLGNDLNAAGMRFYNVAPARNYYAGLKITSLFGTR
jgi:iron complex outermembrane receptor protein